MHSAAMQHCIWKCCYHSVHLKTAFVSCASLPSQRLASFTCTTVLVSCAYRSISEAPIIMFTFFVVFMRLTCCFLFCFDFCFFFVLPCCYFYGSFGYRCCCFCCCSCSCCCRVELNLWGLLIINI